MSITINVSQLNAYVASLFKGDPNLRNIIVKGEISNFVNYKKSGHFYFTLKEGSCAVKAVMFSRYASVLPFLPENGMSVYVTASVEVFERDGVYQLYVSDILPDGTGALHTAVEQLKARLEDEGLFDVSRKKPLPDCPVKIGIVTSREAAALRDMINIISRRFPAAEIMLFPCTVQGRDAPESIADALEFADISGCDVIICGRGGGSLEDLMAFNSEEVVRAFAGCQTPVISAVGHETDTTLSDYAADLRAPTPSAAAELAVPLISDLYDRIEDLKITLTDIIERTIYEKEAVLDSAEKQLELLSPQYRIERSLLKADELEKQLKKEISAKIQREEKCLSAAAAQLDALSPLKIMSRGYSMVCKDGKIVSSAKEIRSGDKLSVHFSDGVVTASAE